MDESDENPAWLERWAKGCIGFHSDEINPYLRRYWEALALPEGAVVFVPLAGKSRDLLWLANAGYEVIANELSPCAVGAFFEEAGLTPRRRRVRDFEIWEAGSITVFCGDFFSLDGATLGKPQACYDRASLVALSPQTRRRYMEHLAALLSPGAQVLLVGISYDQRCMKGPPFSVPEHEIRTLSLGRFDVQVLSSGHDMLAENPRFRDRGLERMEESVYLLTRIDRRSSHPPGSGGRGSSDRSG